MCLFAIFYKTKVQNNFLQKDDTTLTSDSRFKGGWILGAYYRSVFFNEKYLPTFRKYKFSFNYK